MEQYRKTPRADFLDYECGDYFITICTRDRRHYFGRIVNGQMFRSAIGEFVEQQLKNAFVFNSYVDVLQYVVMPNHIHAIVRVDSACQRHVPTTDYVNDNPIEQRNPNPSLRANPTCQRHVPTLSKYVNSLKGAVTKYAKSRGIDFGWQSRYHDHFIRGVRDGENIWNYIRDNVQNWHKDRFNLITDSV